jgi:hypothetical protein
MMRIRDMTILILGVELGPKPGRTVDGLECWDSSMAICNKGTNKWAPLSSTNHQA